MKTRYKIARTRELKREILKMCEERNLFELREKCKRRKTVDRIDAIKICHQVAIGYKQFPIVIWQFYNEVTFDV